MPPTFPLLAIRALSDNTAGSTGLNSTTKVIIVVVIFAILSVFVAMGVGVLKTWKENRDRRRRRLQRRQDRPSTELAPGLSYQQYPQAASSFEIAGRSSPSSQPESSLLPPMSPFASSPGQEPPSPSYSPVVPQGHRAATAPGHRGQADAPMEAAIESTGAGSSRPGEGLMLEPASLAASDLTVPGAPGREDPPAPPPYSPKVLGVDLNSVEPPPAMSTNQTHLPTQSVVVGITIGVLILLVVALFIYISQTKLSRSSASCPPSRSAPDSGPPMILHPIPIYPNTAPPPSPSSSSFATLHRWDSTFKVGGPESSDGEREARDEHVNRGSGRAMGDAGGGIRTSPPPYALRTAPTRETV